MRLDGEDFAEEMLARFREGGFWNLVVVPDEVLFRNMVESDSVSDEDSAKSIVASIYKTHCSIQGVCDGFSISESRMDGICASGYCATKVVKSRLIAYRYRPDAFSMELSGYGTGSSLIAGISCRCLAFGKGDSSGEFFMFAPSAARSGRAEFSGMLVSSQMPYGFFGDSNALASGNCLPLFDTKEHGEEAMAREAAARLATKDGGV